ncbi:Transposase [Daejeonella rubra]|uniref:Transposase n=1 Tax=Daejeonella rubra TaxID=990371 RepID=A0A1G9NHF4_9SPHI|nr:transposase [Daejeonella rubra]SDL85791.1 Transposase [Daejeonella rubra]
MNSEHSLFYNKAKKLYLFKQKLTRFANTKLLYKNPPISNSEAVLTSHFTPIKLEGQYSETKPWRIITPITIVNYHKNILNYFDNLIINASAESFNAKIKALRVKYRGVGNVNFLLFRLAKLYAWSTNFGCDPKFPLLFSPGHKKSSYLV